ncbi:hypothetical protein NQD34_009884 [Periophthalmus magnuspinnatus]|nr:hypothetical protein NQD34_009884 [Periophthalmus magnuspinnatus]
MNKMDLCLKVFIYIFLLRDIQSASQISWLPCKFIDEEVLVDSKGYNNTKLIPRSAVLQFGLIGDPLVNSDAVTFLITQPGQWILYFNVFTLVVVVALVLRYVLRGEQ